MIKVLVITNRFIYGGIEQFLINMFEKGIRQDIQFDLLALTSEKNEELVNKLQACGIPYRTLALEKYSKLKRQFLHYYKLFNIIKEGKYQVVHLNITNPARACDMFVAKLAGAKVRIFHSHSAIKNVPLVVKILKPFCVLFENSATDFCACSDAAAEYLFSKKTVRSRKYQVIPNGIFTEKFLFSEYDRNRIRTKLGVLEDEVLIGHVGRMTEAKNHDFILEIFHEIREMNPASKLLLVGDGELRSEVTQKIKRLQVEDSVIMYGASSSVSELLSAMDVFLFPSRWEGLGISAIEAQCNGLPCYISENVPKSTLLTSNCMQLQTTQGAKYWAQTILDTHKRIDEIEKIHESVYDISNTVKQMEKVYLKALDRMF